MIEIRFKSETFALLSDAINLPYNSDRKKDKNITQSFAEKYLAFEVLINELILETLTKYPENYNHATKQIKLPVYKLHRDSGRIKINGKRYYIHALFAKYCPIMSIEYQNKNVNKANEYSKVFFLPTTTDTIGSMKTLSQVISSIYDEYGKIDMEKLYAMDNVTDDELFERLFPDIDRNNLMESLDRYDYMRVDYRSLTNYINWLNIAEKLADKKKYKLLSISSIILRISKLLPHEDLYTDIQYGMFPMLRNQKESGRIYYKGINIQNFEKDGLRKAVLGRHHEYDIKSCATAWKYSIGKELFPDYSFDVLNALLTNKKELFDALASEIFYDIPWNYDRKISIIKRIINSIGFGAKYSEKRTYPISPGNFKRVALYDLFFSNKHPLEKEKCAELYNRCKDHQVFKLLIEEHNYIEEEIEKHYASHVDKNFKKNPLFKGDDINSRYSRSKFIAYLYQSFETEVMDEVRKLLSSYIKTYQSHSYIIANIHDAIITNAEIDLEYINYHLKSIGYNNIELGHTIVDGWNKVIDNKAIDRFESEHRAIIARETAKARGYTCQTFKQEDITVPLTEEEVWEMYWKRQDELEAEEYL